MINHVMYFGLKKTPFEKTKYKIQEAVKEKGFYIKSDSPLPKKIVLFASLKSL